MAQNRGTGRPRSRVVDAITANGWRPTVGFALLVLVVSIVPVPGGSSEGAAFPVVGPVGIDPLVTSHIDPFVASHLLAYAILAALCLRALVDRGRGILPAIAVAVVLAAGYGAAIELLQVPIPWRSGGLFDAAINAVGAVAGAVVGGLVGPLAAVSTR